MPLYNAVQFPESLWHVSKGINCTNLISLQTPPAAKKRIPKDYLINRGEGLKEIAQ
jgi:hypothetical protein